MDQEFGTPDWGPKIKKSGSDNPPIRNSCKQCFPMVRVNNIRSFSSLFFEIWALLKSFKNDFPMVRAKTTTQKFLKFFLWKWPPVKSWKHDFSGIPWTRGPLGPSLRKRAQNSIQDSLNESSVRPNGTPVMPLLRFRKTQKVIKLRFCWRLTWNVKLVCLRCHLVAQSSR